MNFMQRAVAGKNVGDLRPDYGSLQPLASNAPALVAEVALVLSAGQMSAATQQLIAAAVQTMPAKTDTDLQNRIQATLTLVLASPEYIVQK